MIEASYIESSEKIYWQYVQECCPDLNLNLLSGLKANLVSTQWEDPESALDFNNIAVIALIEAENTDDLTERLFYWEFALEALQQGIELPDSSLCKAHLGIVYSLINDWQTSINFSYQYFTEILQVLSTSNQQQPLGLIYFPRNPKKWTIIGREQLPILLQLEDGIEQALALVIQFLCHAQLCIYTANGFRSLQIATQFNPNSEILNLQLGISGLVNQHLECLAYLHRAKKFAPNSPIILQSLYLAYRGLKALSTAEEWKAIAISHAQQNPEDIRWKWTELDSNVPFTCIPFEDNLLVAVEPSFSSYVTSMLLAQGDWFESEMELWRDQIQPEMTIIDVGANAGVYTFSAAKRVGNLGKVIAIEPFSSCVMYLEATRNINQLNSVVVVAGAASDRSGTARLSVKSSSEANELIADDTDSNENFETVTCFTLDSLIELENLKRVDWLKIDAEGHEIQVLKGASRLLQEFKPNIIYENISSRPDQCQDNNAEVVEYLTQYGYQLFQYRSFLKQLIPINSLEGLQGNLNVIAIANESKNLVLIHEQSDQLVNQLVVDRELPSEIENTANAMEDTANVVDNIAKADIVDTNNNQNLDSYRILMVVSGGLEEFIENAIASIRNCQIDLRYVEIFTPRIVKSQLEKLDFLESIAKITAIEDITKQESLQVNNNYHNYDTDEFGKFTIYKWIAIKSLFKRGIRNVIYTDVDLVWRQNPIPLLQKINSIYDLAIQSEGDISFPINFCTGFMSFVNTDFSHQLIDHLIAKHNEVALREPETNDQMILNSFINANLYLVSEYLVNNISVNKYLVNNIFPLSEILFANGLTAKLMSTSDEALEQIQSSQPEPLIFHANWTIGLENKKKMLQRTGNWFL